MKKPIKENKGEKLSPDNVERVISLLNPVDGSKPITKTNACQVLNIKYNTARLDRIISDHIEKRENDKRRRDAVKGKPLEDHDINYIIEEVLLGQSVEAISKAIYRSAGIIKNAIKSVGIPGYSDEDSFGMFPEACMATEFMEPVRNAEGKIVKEEVVYYPKEDCLVVIDKLITTNYAKQSAGMMDVDYDKKVMKLYRVYSKDTGYHTVYAADLASLKHLEKYGVNFQKLRTIEKYSRSSKSVESE